MAKAREKKGDEGDGPSMYYWILVTNIVKALGESAIENI